MKQTWLTIHYFAIDLFEVFCLVEVNEACTTCSNVTFAGQTATKCSIFKIRLDSRLVFL